MIRYRYQDALDPPAPFVHVTLVHPTTAVWFVVWIGVAIAVNNITRFSKVLVFTAATPGQQGTHHVNLQLQSYWDSKIAAHGFAVDESYTVLIKKQLLAYNGFVCHWIPKNLVIYRLMEDNSGR